MEVSEWPPFPSVRYGEKEVCRLCRRFGLDATEAVEVEGMRDFVEDRTAFPAKLTKLKKCLMTLPCSTAECERGFSLMNIVSTDLRSTLLVSNMSSLMFINLNGPPLHLWRPYVYS